ncbi:hypothetical protein Tco_1048599 [Tanacetum coccineum]
MGHSWVVITEDYQITLCILSGSGLYGEQINAERDRWSTDHGVGVSDQCIYRRIGGQGSYRRRYRLWRSRERGHFTVNKVFSLREVSYCLSSETFEDFSRLWGMVEKTSSSCEGVGSGWEIVVGPLLKICSIVGSNSPVNMGDSDTWEDVGLERVWEEFCRVGTVIEMGGRGFYRRDGLISLFWRGLVSGIASLLRGWAHICDRDSSAKRNISAITRRTERLEDLCTRYRGLSEYWIYLAVTCQFKIVGDKLLGEQEDYSVRK